MKYFNRTLAELPADATFSAGPMPGFSAGFAAAYEDQTRNWSQFGLQFAFSDLEQKQIDAIHERTGKRLAPIIGLPMFKALAKNFEGKELDAEEAEQIGIFTQRMKEFAEFKKQNPDILTYDEMWSEVQAAGRKASETAAQTQELSGFSGWAGSFVGSMAGAFTYRDPLNIATLGLGGTGKYLATRLATEFGANAIVEGINQFTGVQENRELIGLDHGTEQALAQIGMVGAGAAVIRGGAEATAAAWRGLRRKFGSGASDVAAATVAKDAQDMIGKSPFGDSRVADGVHWAELRSVMREVDTPLFSARDRLLATASVGALADRNTDDLFLGSSEPLQDTLAKFFDVSQEREFPMPGGVGRAEIREANRRIQDLTDRVNAAEVRGANLDQQIADVSPPLHPDDATAMIRRVAEINQEMREVEASGGKARDRKARLNKLGKEKAALETGLTASQKAAADLRTLTEARKGVTGEADDLRLRRAQIVSDIARRTPGARRGEIDTKALTAELLGRLDPAQPQVVPAFSRAVPDRAFAERITETQKVLDEAEPRKPEVIKPEPRADGTTDPNAEELVDIGQKGKPVSLDTEVLLDLDGSGTATKMTMREALEELKDDDDLVANMKACLI